MFQNGCIQQKRLRFIWLSIEHLFEQKLNNITMTTGKGRKKILFVRTASEGERSQLQPGSPPLGALVERCDHFRGQLKVHDLIQESRRIIRCEAEIRGANLE